MLLAGKRREGAAAADQLCPWAVLDDAALLHHQDAISLAQVAEPVGDEQQGAAAEMLAQLLHQAAFGVGIEGAGGLIEDHQAGVLQHHAGDGQALLLAAAQTATPLAHGGEIALR